MEKKQSAFKSILNKDGTKSIISSLISILVGMLVGGIIVLIVGLTNKTISVSGALEGIKLIFFGLFSTGRDAAGNLSFGFNAANIGNMLFRATPIILTGLSVAVAFKTGLFNIGASGQYLMGTAASLYIALSIPTDTVPSVIVWILAFLGGMLAGA
ncbi:MAG: ABC transporter permease, partial [Acutalibacteraceae bacterium]